MNTQKRDCRLRREMEHIKIPDQCGSPFLIYRKFRNGANTDMDAMKGAEP